MATAPDTVALEAAAYGAADPSWVADRLARYPWLFHGTGRELLPVIAEHGLRPPVQTGNLAARYPGRRHAVYLGDHEVWRDGWLHEWTGFGGRVEDAVTIAVDLRLVPVNRLVADEDALNPVMGAWLSPGDWGLPPYDESRWGDAGTWAAELRLGAQPGLVEATWEDRGTVAVLGAVPPQVLALDVQSGTWPAPPPALITSSRY